MKNASLVLAFLLSSVVLGEAHAGAWTPEAGSYYLKLWDRTLIGDGGYLANGNYVSTPETFVDTSISYYFELGVFDWLTLITYGTPIGWAAMGESSTAYAGPLVLGARAGVASPDERLQLAVEAHYGYTPPLGETAIVAGAGWDYTPTLETSRFELELQAGYALPLGAWVVVHSGARYANRRGVGGALYGMAQLGWMSTFGLSAEVHANWVVATDKIERNNISGAGETSYLGAGLSLSYWLTQHWALYAGAEGGLVINANAGAPALLFGFELRS